MKRKLLIFTIVTTIVLSCFMLVACNPNKENQSKNSPKNQLTYGQKYIYQGHLNVDENVSNYFIFDANGTGIYHYYTRISYNGNPYVTRAYTISFKYTKDTAQGIVYCFYDTFTFDDINTDDYGAPEKSTWTAVLNYTDKFLYKLDTLAFYVTEDFSESNPNFGK